MNRKFSFFVFVILLLVIPAAGYAQVWSGLIDPSRAIDWSQSGIPGGVPNRTTICATIDAGSFGNGSSNATTGIQSALNSCGSGQVVKLSAGTFLISGSLSIPSNVTLRGSGPQNTILNARGTSGAVISMGPYGSAPNASGSVSINGGASAGSTSITVSSTSNIAVGRYLIISELNDSSYVSVTTSNGTCSWCDNSMWGGGRVRGQIVEVTSVSGNNIGISPGLYSNYSLSPLATPFAAGVKNAGVEDLQVYGNNTGYQTNFAITMSAYCWVKNVESNYADGDQVNLQFAYRSEVRDSYFSNAFSHTSGTTDADVLLAGKTSASLVENNILERLHSSVMVNWGAAGNVVSYNYSIGAFDSNATNVVVIDFDMHGAHPQFNLLEGNVTPHIFPDSFWGTGSHNTFYRNWATGTTKIAPFVGGGYTGRGVVDWAHAHLANQQNRGISLSYTHTRDNIIGNVSGSADVVTAVGGSANLFKSGSKLCASCIVPTQRRAYDGTFYAFDIGYDNGSDSSGSGLSTDSVTTVTLHGNFDISTNAAMWASNRPILFLHRCTNHPSPPGSGLWLGLRLGLT